jgi:hypothetical protein
MATSYLTKSSGKKTAKGSGAPAKGGEKEVSAKKTAPKKTAASGAKKKTAPKTTAASGAKKTAAASGAIRAKKTAFRDVPKASPLKGMPIEQWANEKTSGWQAEAVAKIVSLVKKAAPDATASIKWGQPVFESNGPFAYIRPARGHVTFGFWRGGEIADPKKLLEGDGDRMQHMKLAGLDAIDEKAITAMVKEAVRLNREKGSPTMRSKG